MLVVISTSTAVKEESRVLQLLEIVEMVLFAIQIVTQTSEQCMPSLQQLREEVSVQLDSTVPDKLLDLKIAELAHITPILDVAPARVVLQAYTATLLR